MSLLRYIKANIHFKNVFLLIIFVYLFFAAKNTNTLMNISKLVHDNEKVEIKDILIVIKTSVKTHKTRIKNIVDTWYQFAKGQVYAVTDNYIDRETKKLLDGKLISTICPSDRSGLCCKFGSELELYFSLNKNFKWFCHFDDDNYVNIPNLLKLLNQYNFNHYYYLGKSSWDVPVVRTGPVKYIPNRYAKFWFGTFGAGVCLSNATMHHIRQHANAVEYKTGCANLGLPDDTYLGFLLEWKNKIYFTNVTTMNHHLEVDQFKYMNTIADQVTFSFGETYFEYFSSDCNCKKKLMIKPEIESLYGDTIDPFRLKSLHCLLFPETNDCKLLLTKALEKSIAQQKELKNLTVELNRLRNLTKINQKK